MPRSRTACFAPDASAYTKTKHLCTTSTSGGLEWNGSLRTRSSVCDGEWLARGYGISHTHHKRLTCAVLSLLAALECSCGLDANLLYALHRIDWRTLPREIHAFESNIRCIDGLCFPFEEIVSCMR